MNRLQCKSNQILHTISKTKSAVSNVWHTFPLQNVYISVVNCTAAITVGWACFVFLLFSGHSQSLLSGANSTAVTGFIFQPFD